MRNKTLFAAILSLMLVINIPAFAASYAPVSKEATKSDDAIKAEATAAVAEFKLLSKQEQRAKFREVKNLIKEHKALVKEGRAKDGTLLLAVIFAILIPFVGVLIHEGRVTNHFWIALLLTLLGWLPGMIYALLVVTSSI